MLNSRAVWCVVLAGGVMACGGGADGPADIARAFWMASRDGETELARSHVLPGGNANLSAQDDGPPISEVEVEDAEIHGDSARVPTHLTGVTKDGSPVDVRFETIMVRDSDRWLVDLDRTTGQMLRAMIGLSVKDLGEAIGNAMADGMKEAMGAMAEGFRELSDSLEGADKK